jgi:hypothetical protein
MEIRTSQETCNTNYYLGGNEMILYKGFDKDLKCRDFQFEVGKEYEEERAELCSTGFHACENPFDVWDYYNVAEGRFCEVEMTPTEERKDDSKRVGKKIKIVAEIGLKGMIDAWLKIQFEKGTEDKKTQAASGDSSKLAASGYSSKLAASGYSSKLAASGYCSQLAASGNFSQLAASGNFSKLAASGYSSQLAASGYCSQLAASGNFSQLAASGNFSKLAASGYSSQLAASGYSSQLAASGDSSQLAASGNYSVVMCAGHNSTAKAKKGSWITLAEWENVNGEWTPIHVITKKVDGVKIKEDTFYRLVNGKFTEEMK